MARMIALKLCVLMLVGCESVSPGGFDDLCRGSANCAPRCGSVATGASPDCSPGENEGRTRG